MRRKLKLDTATCMLFGLTPDWGREYIAGALVGDAQAAERLVIAAHNADRGEIVKVLWRARVAAPALRTALQAAWEHDHAVTWNAFGYNNLILAFKEAQFPTDGLPDSVTVWRGEKAAAAVPGISWTLDRDVACWFACRFDGTPRVLRHMIRRSDVLAHLVGREEDEVVLDIRARMQAAVDGDEQDWRAAYRRHEMAKTARQKPRPA